jgi:hypothetical protein
VPRGKYVGFRIQNQELTNWLTAHGNISDTCKEALLKMKQGEEISAELMQRLGTLLSITEKVDKRDRQIHAIVQEILDSSNDRQSS